jgi:hypothetical protein
MKEGSIVIEIENNNGDKEGFLDELHDLFHQREVKYKSYKINDDKLIAPIASKPFDGESEVLSTIALYAPFYKITKLEIPDRDEANKLLEEQLDKELEISITTHRKKV